MGGIKLYGKLKPVLNEKLIKCGRDKFMQILRDENLLVKHPRKYIKTTNSNHSFNRYPNIIHSIDIVRSEQVFVSDITYIKTKKGFMYLYLITDAYSKQIMGWELADNLKVLNAVKALKKALKNRKYPGRKLIHHSDRGLQYCHPSYIDLLRRNKVKISMTNQYDPYENAVAERVNGILKMEYDVGGQFVGKKDAMREIKYAIWLYNTDRPHLSCHGLVPEEAHKLENYKLKTWSKKLSSKGYPLEEKEISLNVN
ncbi:MAG: hypothetical protein C0599_14605 [Salinivirgaceae bacterium]|nr:MAG: hypothetical protein C0599_14605 [Salinivirgaceae bacterium]